MTFSFKDPGSGMVTKDGKSVYVPGVITKHISRYTNLSQKLRFFGDQEHPHGMGHVERDVAEREVINYLKKRGTKVVIDAGGNAVRHLRY